MLKRFEVENFRNFKNRTVVDFSKVGGYQFNQDCVTGNSLGKMLIYGRNASGKTNFGRAILDIALGIGGKIILPRGMFLNADSKKGRADFRYVFQFDESEVVYSYGRVSEYEMVWEELSVNGEVAFSFDFKTKQGVFSRLDLLGADTVVVDRYLEAAENSGTEGGEANSSLPFLILPYV